jgi:hypothetical protein
VRSGLTDNHGAPLQGAAAALGPHASDAVACASVLALAWLRLRHCFATAAEADIATGCEAIFRPAALLFIDNPW